MKKLTKVAVGLLACAAPGAWAQDDAEALIARIEAPQVIVDEASDKLSIAQLMAALKVPGVSIAVVRDFRLHWAKAYGVADVASGRPADTGTRFQAASLSKPVTAMGAMRLVQAGKLDLDADINRYLASWRVPRAAWTGRQAVTARSLFSHTSGADDGFGFPGYLPQAPLPTAVQILEGKPPSNVGKVLFTRAPYVRFKYSGGGVMAMQVALTDIAGQPFAPLMQSTVLDPLQMTRSSYLQPQTVDQAPNTALGHDKLGQRMAAPWHVS